MEFAKELVKERALTNAEFRPINLGAVRSAAEVHIYGTTPNITPAVTFENQPVGNGKPGPIALRLFEMLKQEMIPDSSRLTPVFD